MWTLRTQLIYDSIVPGLANFLEVQFKIFVVTALICEPDHKAVQNDKSAENVPKKDFDKISEKLNSPSD